MWGLEGDVFGSFLMMLSFWHHHLDASSADWNSLQPSVKQVVCKSVPPSLRPWFRNIKERRAPSTQGERIYHEWRSLSILGSYLQVKGEGSWARLQARQYCKWWTRSWVRMQSCRFTSRLHSYLHIWSWTLGKDHKSWFRHLITKNSGHLITKNPGHLQLDVYQS